jgi:hypothetical protein
MPTSLFTQSADAIWRSAKYTRQVDAIHFTTLGEFRGGFANEIQYNFWAGELLREWMPFYVMYELTPASAGSRLTWKGQVFWERPAGGFEEIVHHQIASREITTLGRMCTRAGDRFSSLRVHRCVSVRQSREISGEAVPSAGRR